MADNNAADAVAADAPAADQDEMIVQFSDVTGVRADRARFYLESANWTLQVHRKHTIYCKPFDSHSFMAGSTTARSGQLLRAGR